MPALYSRTDDTQILQLRDANGLTYTEIATRLGRASPGGIRTRYLKLKEYAGRRRISAKTRACMRCDQPFPSPHAGVRWCDKCRASVSASPFEPDCAAGLPETIH